MGWEYVVVSDIDQNIIDTLLGQGWHNFTPAFLMTPKRPDPRSDDHPFLHIMRRPKDEPRMWTEGEIRRLTKGYGGPVPHECAMPCDPCATWCAMLEHPLIGLLKRRKEKLQAAIDKVMKIYWGLTYRTDPMYLAVRQNLHPLATNKEETNG